MQKYLDQTESSEVKNWINKNLANYLKNNPESVGEIEHIIDYFKAREKWCVDRNKSFNLIKMSYEQAVKLSNQWVSTLKKKGKDIVETESDVETIIDFNNGVRLVKLVGKSAFAREGHLMSHCVASYYGNDKVCVYSLRDKKNEPHCTIEIVKNGDVNQIKGKGNGDIHPRYIKYVIKILEHFNKDIRTSELTYLGYDEVTPNLFAFILQKAPTLKYITYKGKNFIYRHQKL